MAKLVFVLDDGQVITVPLAGPMTVGSEDGNDVLVEDASIASRHAEFIPTESGGYSIRDLGSLTGTQVNGSTITHRDLSHGDEVIFGALRGRFLVDEEPAHELPEDRNDHQMETEERLRELNASYHDLHAKHQMVLGMVSTLGAQEKQKLASLERLHADIDELEQKIITARESLKSGEEALSETNALLKESQSAHGRLSGEVSQFQTTRDQLKDDLAALEKLRTEAETSFRKSEDELLTAASSLAEKQALQTKLEKNIAELQAHQKELEEKFASLQQRSEEAGQTIQAQQKESESLLKTIEDLRSQRDSAQQETEKLVLEKQRLESETAALAEQELKLQETIQAHEKATEELANTTARLSQARDSLSQTQAQKETLSAEHTQLEARLSAIKEALTLSVAETERQHAEHTALIEGHQNALQKLTQELDDARGHHETLQQKILCASQQHLELHQNVESLTGTVQARTGEIESLNSRRDELTATVQGLGESIAAEETRLTEMQTLANEWEAHIHRFAHEFKELEKQHNELEVHVAKLQGTEEHLLQAKHQLDETTKSHTSLTVALAALNARHEERQHEVTSLEQAIVDLTQRHSAATSALTDGQQQLETFRASSTELRERTIAEQQTLDASLKSIKEELTTATVRLQSVIATHDELQRENAKLDEVRAMLRKAESDHASLTARNDTLTGQAAGLDAKVKGLNDDITASSTRLSSLRNDEAVLIQKRQQLAENELAERRRFEELRQLNMDAEQAGNAQKAELDAAIESRKREMVVVERQLLEMCVARDDLDKRYALLATMPEDSPEALKLWHEIQKLKEEAAEKLPGGIKPRINARTTVVPRNRG